MRNRWKNFITIGGFAAFVVALLIVLAVVGYLFWPWTYESNLESTERIFTALQTRPFGTLVSLDLPMLIINAVNIVPFIALYFLLKEVNRAPAFLALVFGLFAVVLIFTIRPLQEMLELSKHYVRAGRGEKPVYLAAGTALLAKFHGTAWFVQTWLLLASGFINSILMLKSRRFRKIDGIVGIVNSAVGFGFFLPVIGIGLLLVNTVGSILWYIFIGISMLRFRHSGESN